MYKRSYRLSLSLSGVAMSAMLRSPGVVLSDEEECGAVFESTAADIGGLIRSQHFGTPLQEISVIAPAAVPRTPAKVVR